MAKLPGSILPGLVAPRKGMAITDYDTLIRLSGLTEEKFVEKYLERAYTFCFFRSPELRDSMPFRMYSTPNEISEYSEKRDWVRKAIEYGFYPIEIGLKNEILTSKNFV
jgi:hypothetical protein